MIAFACVATVQAALLSNPTADLELEAPDLEARKCNPRAMAKLFNATIPNFGSDCAFWASLFSEDGNYYHAHAGHHSNADGNLEAACTGYAGFCPPGKCSFKISGKPLVRGVKGKCHALVPYLWSELPANAAGLEPHTGWEYIIASYNKTSPVGYSIERFSEIETTFSVPYNWGNPSDDSGEDWKVANFQKFSQAQKGECNNPIQPFLTDFFASMSPENTLYRQQGDAVALAAGGVCQAVVPYAALVNGKMQEGKFVFTMSPETTTRRWAKEMVNAGNKTYTAYQDKPLAIKFISYRE